LEKVFQDKFLDVSSDGNIQLKNAYLLKLKSGSFIHDSISVEENT
jgi:hypothetical protein